MKKKLYMETLVAACVTATAAINWSTVDNLAKDKTVVVSTNATTAARIVDGDATGAGWQAAKLDNQWFFVDLGSSRDFTDIEINWDGAAPAEYSIYVLETQPQYSVGTYTLADESTVEGNKLDAAWLAAQTADVKGTHGNAKGYDSFTGTFKGQYILVYADRNNNLGNTYGIRCDELSIANISADERNTVNGISLSNAKAVVGQKGEMVLTAYNVTGESVSLENLKDIKVVADEGAVITDRGNGVYEVSSAKAGVYNVTATAKCGDKLLMATASFSAEYDWSKANNVCLNKGVQAFSSHNNEKAYLSIDGRDDTRWETGDNITSGVSYWVDLGNTYRVGAIGVIWDNAYANHYKYYTATVTETVDGVEQPVWEELVEIDRMLSNANRYTDTYELPVSKEARYVKMECLQSQVWGMSFYEFMVDGENTQAAEVSKVEVELSADGLFVGETSNVTAKVYDQFGGVMDETVNIEVEGNCGTYAGGVFTATKTGKGMIKATCGTVSAEKEITVATSHDRYFIDGKKMTATSDAKNAEGADRGNGAIDGSETGNGVSSWVAGREGYGDNEPKGEHEHNLVIDFGIKYDVEMITLSWEGANSNRYDILVSADGENYTPAYSIDIPAEQAAREDRCYGKDLREVRYLKVNTHENATGYGLNLFELRAYGERSEKSVLSNIELLSSKGTALFVGESSQIKASGYDQFGMPMDMEVTMDGAPVDITAPVAFNKEGTYTFTAGAGDMMETLIVNVYPEWDIDTYDKLRIGYPDEKGDSVEVWRGNRRDNLVRVEGQDHQLWNDGSDAFNLCRKVNPDDAEYTYDDAVFIIEFSWDPSFMELHWETAAPTAYKVYIGETVEDVYQQYAQPVYIYNNERTEANPAERIQLNGNRDKGYMSSPMAQPADMQGASHSNPRVVRISPSAALNEGWGVKLRSAKFYGTILSVPTGIMDVQDEETKNVDVFSMSGIVVRRNVAAKDATRNLPVGMYIIDGRKVMVK